MGNQKRVYVDTLVTVKRLLRKMTEVEDSLSYLEEKESRKWWVIGPVEIEINDIKNDTYYLTVAVSPEIEKRRGYAKSCVHYFYKIEGKEIEREMAMTLDSPTFIDKGKKVLEELVFILNSGNLVLKKGNAP